MNNSVKKIENVIWKAQFGTRAAMLALSMLLATSQGVAEANERTGRELIMRSSQNQSYTERLSQKQSYTERINAFGLEQAMKKNPLPNMLIAMTTIINDERELALEMLGDDKQPYYNIEKLKLEVMDVLSRLEGRYPVVTGEIGSGKSAVINAVFDDIVNENFSSSIHSQDLSGKVGFRVSARNFDKVPYGGMNLKKYIETLIFIAQNVEGIDPIIVIDEVGFLDKQSLSTLTEMAPFERNGIPVILEADTKSYSTAIKEYPQFERYEQRITVPETKSEDMPKLLKQSGYLKMIRARYDIKLSEDVVDAIIEVAPDYRLDLAEPARTMQLIEAIAIRTARESGSPNVLKKDVYKFVAESTGVPVVPQDRVAFTEYMDSLRERVLAKVLGQDHIVNGLIDQFQAALLSKGKRKHTLAMVMGPTGVGKTYGAEVLAEEFYGSNKKVLKLDMTQFTDDSKLNILFGAPNGYVSAKEDKGVICEFLDGVAKGGGVIIMDEFEEAHSKVVTRMMEMFDQGYIRGGDGKVRHLGRSLVVMTSNKQSDKLLPSSRVKGMTEEELDRIVTGISQEKMKKAWTEKTTYTEKEGSQVKAAVVERIDQFYYAKPLLKDLAVQVTNLEVNKYIKDQAAADDIELIVDESYSRYLTDASYNQENGARQLRSMVQNTLGQAIRQFRKKYGQEASRFEIRASVHPSRQTETFVTIKEVGSDNELTISGPKVPVTNKLLDADFRKRMKYLEKNLKSEVFGQDEAIESIMGAANARYLKANKAKAMAGFLIGTTGSGKTQLGKSTAKHLFGREDAVGILSMGSATDVDKMGGIFSPPPPYVGSDKEGEFETFLNKFPDGGVIIFDEMSNVGGNSIEKKNAIFKTYFYEMLEEGIYTNPSGKTYDLSNYLILFTGNDGEKEFQGLRSDSMIEETYKQVTKNQARVNQILIDAGIPKAFLGRLGFVTLMRPALSGVRKLIAEKLLTEWKKDIEAAQPFDIIFEEGFIEEMAELMFAPEEGARSIIKFLDKYAGRAVGGTVEQYDWDELLENGLRGEIHVGLDVDKTDNPFYEDKPYQNKAKITVKGLLNGAVLTNREVDFTASAAFTPQAHLQDATDTAFHEMGHAVTSFPEVTGKKLVKINVVPEKIGDMSTLGYAQYTDSPVKGKNTRKWFIHMLAGLLGGSEAERIFSSRPMNAGRSNDVEKAGKIARKLVLEHHLIPELDIAHAYADENGKIKNLPTKEQEIFDNYVREAMEEARQLAIATIKANGHVVAAGAELLLKEGDINGETYDKLVERGDQAVKKTGFLKQQAVKLGITTAAAAYPIDIQGLAVKSCDELLQ